MEELYRTLFLILRYRKTIEENEVKFLINEFKNSTINEETIKHLIHYHLYINIHKNK